MATWSPPPNLPPPDVDDAGSRTGSDAGPAAGSRAGEDAGPAPRTDRLADQPTGWPGGTATRWRLPRPGELTPGWSVVFGLGWLAVGVALAAVWVASRQLGLSTWWLGPASQPRSVVVNLAPFVVPIALVTAAANRIRHLPWWGLAGAAVTAVIGVLDLGRVVRLGVVELVIAGAAAAVSVAALSGTYRRADPAGADGAGIDQPAGR